jgi:CubicO group peptidase (beta-lactamase class C family)
MIPDRLTHRHLLRVLLILGLFALRAGSDAQQLYFPPLTGTTWETVTPASLGWNVANIDTLRAYLGTQNTRAFILLKDGRIAIEMYFGTFTRDSAWYWASAGKSLTSVLVGIARREGVLSLTDTTSRWLGKGWTSESAAQEGRITIRHQLSMTSGLDDGVSDPYCTEPSCLIYKADAGARWAYHNGPYTLLDSVLRASTGTSLNAFFTTRIASKTGMTGLFVRQGYNNVFGSTARSMARFGLLMLNRGVWGTTPVLDDTAYVREMSSSSQPINPSYGYLWWLNGKSSYMVPQSQFVFPGPLNPSAPADMIAALGKNGQFIDVVPSRNIVFVRMGDAPENVLVPFMMNDDIWKYLNKIIPPPISTGMKEHEAMPTRFALEQNYPNPFNPNSDIRYQISEFGIVKLAVYDILGREVAVLVNELKAPGTYQVRFDAAGLPSGIYFCRLQSGISSETRTMALIR